MRRAACLMVAAAITLLNTGCANGPLARFLRGGECSNCSALPAPSDTYTGAYSLETSGTCGVNGCSTCGNGQVSGDPALMGWSNGAGVPMEGQIGADLSGGLPIGQGGISYGGTGGFSASPSPGPAQ